MYLKAMQLVPSRFFPSTAICLLFCAASVLFSGCGTVRRSVVGGMSDEKALEVYTSDNDPELIRDAFPFGLKTYELLITQDPENRELYLTAAAGFIQYASVFLEDEADMLEADDFTRSRDLRKRAAKLYQRGCMYALQGLELHHAGFGERVRNNQEAMLARMKKKDVPYLFWAGAGWVGTISNDPANMAKMAELSMAEALMRRALELDETYGNGAIHEFFVVFEGGRSEAMGGSAERAIEHYQRAQELNGGKKASPHVSLATTVAVQRQDLDLFRDLLDKALAVDVDEVKKWRLGNILSQRKARWLLESIPDLFVEYEEQENE